MIPGFLAIPLASYFSFFHDYFLSDYILEGLLLGVGALLGIYAAFRSTSSQGVRSNLLLAMVATSTAIWIFVISSLAFCLSLVQEYWISAEPAIALVAKLALATTVGASSILVFVFRKRALDAAYAEIYGSKLGSASGEPRANRSFLSLKVRAPPRVRSTSLYILDSNPYLPASLAFDARRLKIVALQASVESLLDDDELESVMAHEIGHIVNRDGLQKTIATGYRLAFPFDPLARLIEAAIYRSREIAADEFSAKFTGKSASLASALLKIYENIDLSVPKIPAVMGPSSSQLSLSSAGEEEEENNDQKVGGRPKRRWRESVRMMFSKQPRLQDRIERLLEGNDGSATNLP